MGIHALQGAALRAFGLDAGKQRPVFGLQRIRCGKLTALQRAIEEIGGIGRVQVFRHGVVEACVFELMLQATQGGFELTVSYRW